MGKNKLYFLGIFFIAFVGCQTKQKLAQELLISKNHIFSIEGPCIFESTQGIDSEIGTMTCGEVVFEYDYGRYSDSGPMTKEEAFLKAFTGNYYAKFFEKIHIDEKLYRMFIDSVRLVQIINVGKNKNAYLFDCSVCEQVAVLEFRNKTYYYPYYTGSGYNSDKFDIQLDTVQGYYRKLYFSKVDSLDNGLYLKRLNTSKLGNKLSIKTKSMVIDNIALKRILYSVRLIK